MPWFEKMTENKVASDNANNSAMIMQMLQMYLSKFGLKDFIPQVKEMLSYGCWCQIFKARLISISISSKLRTESSISTIPGKAGW